VTDDIRSADRDDAKIVGAAIRLARQISWALGSRRSRLLADEAERAAILREVFEGAASGVLPDECGGEFHG
jgi:hypothetical protein